VIPLQLCNYLCCFFRLHTAATQFQGLSKFSDVCSRCLTDLSFPLHETIMKTGKISLQWGYSGLQTGFLPLRVFRALPDFFSGGVYVENRSLTLNFCKRTLCRLEKFSGTRNGSFLVWTAKICLQAEIPWTF